MAERQESPSASSVSTMMKQKRLDRSCILCHRRKIRCDKKSPCRNCSRADLLCYYPEPEQSVRRPHKTTIADVSARLARLERTISALSNGSATSQAAALPEPPTPEGLASMGSNGSFVESASGEEKLVRGDSSSRYFNEALLSRVLEEEQEIKSLIENQHDKNHSQNSATSEIDPLFSAFQKPSYGSGFTHPPRQCAIQLWQAFVNNVDPLFKILHVPSIQGTIYGAINNPVDVNADINALIFAVYFAGATSLSSEQVMNLLGLTKNAALNMFKQGLEQSLATANFLDTPTSMALQAITLFMFCFRAVNGGRAIWTLNGLVTRSAQSIGLHRDGTNFKLSPFECEMRRRLWWLIIANDSRVAEDHGLKIDTSDSATDVALPSNVNDSELYPAMKDFPTAESKWSDMSFTLIIIEAHNFRKLSPLDTISPTDFARQQAFQTLKARFQTEYLQYCDQNIPIQRMTYLMGKLLPSKLDFVTRQQWLQHHTSRFTTSSSPSQTSGSYQGTEQDLIHACEVLEISHTFQTDGMLQGFKWGIQTYPQYHVLIFVFRYLCNAPESPLTEKAWRLANACFGSETSPEVPWNWKLLSRLREKAKLNKDPASAYGNERFINEETHDGIKIGQTFDMENAAIDELRESDSQTAQLLSSMNWTPGAFDLTYWDSMNDGVAFEDSESLLSKV